MKSASQRNANVGNGKRNGCVVVRAFLSDVRSRHWKMGRARAHHARGGGGLGWKRVYGSPGFGDGRNRARMLRYVADWRLGWRRVRWVVHATWSWRFALRGPAELPAAGRPLTSLWKWKWRDPVLDQTVYKIIKTYNEPNYIRRSSCNTYVGKYEHSIDASFSYILVGSVA